MKFLGNIPNIDKLMLLDFVYHPARKDNDHKDCIDIIYKDLITGEKHLKSIDLPEMEIYFTKPEYRNYTYNKTHMELDKCDKHTCQYKSLPWYIAKEAGDDYVQALKRMMETGRYQDINRIQTYPYVFGSDIPIDVFYRVQWLLEYDNEEVKPLTKLYLDIETDIIDCVGFPRDGKYPINAITVVDDTDKTVYTFLLNNPNNPLIQEFINDIDGVVNEMHEMFDESYGYLDYKIYMYDDERDLLISTFKLINTLKRDFCLIWNGCGFDIPYIIDRIKVLGLDPADVMCHKDFKHKMVKSFQDERNFAIATKGSFLKLSSYTKFIDQMILYAATRKGQSELRSNALNAIAWKELKDEKLDYTDEANIKTLPYVNYRKFVIYNIKDTLLQLGIERKVGDVDGAYLRAYSNCVDIDKVFKQTVMLKNRAYYEYFLQGNVIGNNVNVFQRDVKGGFSGAIVGNPLLNSHTGMKLFGKKSMYVFDNVIDMDFSAMYPNVIVAFNIERCTMIFKLILEGYDHDPYDHQFIDDEIVDIDTSDEDEDDDEKEVEIGYDAGKDFMDNYLTGDIVALGSKWFNLPKFDELHEDFKKEFKIKPKKRFSIRAIVGYIADKLNI